MTSLLALFQPDPTATPTMLRELTTPAAAPGWLDSLTTPVVNWFGAHPWVFVVVAAAVLATNAIRTTWPDRAKRPPLAAFVLGLFDPIALNFWQLARWIGGKFGFPVQAPADDPKPADPAVPQPALPNPNAIKDPRG